MADHRQPRMAATLIGLKDARQSSLITMADLDFNFVDNRNNRLTVNRCSMPDVKIGALDKKHSKTRLKDTDLDWIANNWHKKNMKRIAKHSNMSQDLLEMVNKKSARPMQTIRQSTSEDKVSQRILDNTSQELHLNKTINESLNILDYSHQLANQLSIDAEKSEEKNVYQSSVVENREVSYLMPPQQLGKTYNTKMYNNSYKLCPVANERFYKKPRIGKKTATIDELGFHPYAIRLPTDLKVVMHTSNDFYTPLVRKPDINTKTVSRITSSRTKRPISSSSTFEQALPILPIPPQALVCLIDEHIADMDHDHLNETTYIDLNDTFTDRTPRTDSNRKKPKNLNIRRDKMEKYASLILKDIQDVFTMRKCPSAFPYKSYWLTCINSSLKADDTMAMQDIGYYRVQPFKDSMTFTEDDYSIYDCQDEMVEHMDVRREMYSLFLKASLDVKCYKDKFNHYEIEKYGKVLVINED
jgi:hypothetical protein